MTNKNHTFMKKIKKAFAMTGTTLVLMTVLAVSPAAEFAGYGMGRVFATSNDTTSNDAASNDATSTSAEDSDETINSSDRQKASEELMAYKNGILARYQMDEMNEQNVEAAFYKAIRQIADYDWTKAEMWAIVAAGKSDMEAAATGSFDHYPTNSTSEYLKIADNWKTPTVSYGQKVSIVLPIMNFGTEELRDLIVEPKVDSSVDAWPFKLDQTSYLQTEPFIPGNKNKDAAFANRREFTFIFTTRDDVKTGYYPLTFLVSYTKGDVRCAEPEEVTVFVKTVGKPENGTIGGTDGEASKAKPRIVVTGFETNPENVYAGDTFTLTIHVKNTSSEQSVTNVLFDMQAAEEGSDKTNTYSAFLPTSGASSVYMDSIGTNATADIVIEMTAKADLAQKPYVLDVNMKFDAGAMFDLTDKASVSIPILQESRFDTSIPEIAPADITVGGQSNVMLSIYNTGKTTLNNVTVKFVADSIDEASAFVGNLQSGNTGNVDVMLTGIAPTMDDGTVKMIISYEDEGGNVTEVEKTITLYVTEEYYEDFMGDQGMVDMGMMEEEKKGPGKGLIIGIIVAVAVVAAGVVFFLLRKRKKAAKEAEELLDEDMEI